MNISSKGAAVYGGHFEHGSAFGDSVVINVADIGIFVGHAVIEGGTYGISCPGNNYGHTILNCTFHSQATAGVYVNGANLNVLVINPIFDVDDTAADYAIQRDSGSYVVFNGITDADTEALSGFTSPYANSTYNLTFTNTDPLTSISGNNFKPNRGQTVADTYVIDKGLPLWFHASTASPYPGLGAFISYDLPAVDKVDSSDTVFGTTGTAAGGGGLGAGPANKSGGKQ